MVIDETEQAICSDPPCNPPPDYAPSWAKQYSGQAIYSLPGGGYDPYRDGDDYLVTAARSATNVVKTHIAGGVNGLTVDTESGTFGTIDNALTNYDHTRTTKNQITNISCGFSNFNVTSWGNVTRTTESCPGTPAYTRTKLVATAAAQADLSGQGCQANGHFSMNVTWTFRTVCQGCFMCAVNDPVCGIMYGSDCGTGCVVVGGQCHPSQ